MRRKRALLTSQPIALAAWIACTLMASPAFADDNRIFDSLVSLRDEQQGSTTGPVSLVHRLTSWQSVPLFSVLDDREADDPDQYVMTHPVFAFVWEDGRMLVVDAGLSLDEAVAFGKPATWMGAGEVRCDPDAWKPLLEPGRRIGAIVFSHVHVDHTIGVRELCKNGPVPVWLSPQQEVSDERYEVQARDQLRGESPACVRFDPWQAEAQDGIDPAVSALTGFPGAYRVAVPGHTPGSQMIVAFVRSAGDVKGIVITGDVVNHRLAFERNVAKPWWYRWFIVREDEDAQQHHRRLLHRLDSAGFEIRVNHDLRGPQSESDGGGCPTDSSG